MLLATSQTRDTFSGPRVTSGCERLRGIVAWYPPTDLLRLHRAETGAAVDAGVVRSFGVTGDAAY